MNATTPAFAAFPVDEHRERLARARDALRGAGLDGCVSVAPESHFYLAGYDTWVSANSPQALVFATGGGEPTLIVRDIDAPLAHETAWVSDIRTYHLYSDDVAGLIADILRDKGAGGGRVAVELQSAALPLALGDALRAALVPAEMVDATALLGDLRVVKSAREIGCLRRAAEYATAGLAALRRALAPGVGEIALAAALEGAMRAAGSDYWSIPTELASGPRTPGGHATPRRRAVEPGDLVHVEFAGVERRYHAVGVHTMACGEPGARAREVYDLARASLAAGIAAVAPGVPVEAVEAASLEPLRRAGVDQFAKMRFGYGIGVAYPPIWLESMQISHGFRHVLAPYMAFVLHACLELPDEGLGVIQGGTYLLTEDGLEQLVGGGDVALDIV